MVKLDSGGITINIVNCERSILLLKEDLSYDVSDMGRKFIISIVKK